ncbi:hypothetical protein [Micromonospora sp. IBHARD004]|uniref:hypothetical protein n=1 Tax=Micromonospora sp. IBHARD004 TaxID=3457764 RepID=UPI0040583CCD
MIFAAVSLVAVPASLDLGWDEVVYVSQHGKHAPPAFMSAPRARGVTLLVWPVASWLDSTVVLRLFLTVTAAASLGLAFWVWSRVSRWPGTAAIAAGLYASLWTALFYANAAMPNHYTAMATVAAVGCFLLAAAEPARPGAYLGLVAALAAVPAFRRWRLTAAVVAGLVLGGAPWAVEAELRYGGLLERIRQAGHVQGGAKPQFSLGHVISTLDGPILCRPCGSPVRWPAVLWWLALAVLMPLAVRAAHRAGMARTAWLPFVVAVAMAFPYLFLIGYSAPRFLLPTYAVALVCAAPGLAALFSTAVGQWRRVVAAVIALGFAGHLAIQAGILHHVVAEQVRGRGDWTRLVQTLQSQGVRPPCVISGHEAIPIAYYAGCRALEDRGYNRNASTAQLRQAAATGRFALLVKGSAPPDWAKDCHRIPVPNLTTSGWEVCLPQRPATAPK